MEYIGKEQYRSYAFHLVVSIYKLYNLQLLYTNDDHFCYFLELKIRTRQRGKQKLRGWEGTKYCMRMREKKTGRNKCATSTAQF